ncbi:MAG TPA: Gmad2 immunoglobulin-like domain-containing protein [Cryptosporangiaceae bacterium]|nr:Gmad2 immunoglobulin-like domain-containing protein [Cryptosporangiaceae bacterium]
MNRPTTLVALLVAATAFATACGSQSGTLGEAPTGTSPTATPPPTATPTVPPDTTVSPGTGKVLTIQVWFTRGGRLFATSRSGPWTVTSSRRAINSLMAGPTAVEAGAGVTNGVDRMPYTVSIGGGVATVDLPAAFYTGGRDHARLRQAQVVYSLTQFSTVTRVGFQKDGRATGAPVGRADHADLLPPIVVTSPVIGSTVTSPVVVAGTANVYEATVSVRILDSTGAELVTTFTTATCGSGCRGSYRHPVRFRVGATQRGTVEVFQVSPADGSRTHVVRIPVTLSP